MNLISIFSGVISIVGFILYLLEKGGLIRIKFFPPWLLITVASVCLVTTVIIYSFFLHSANEIYPLNKKQAQAASIVATDMIMKIGILDNEMGNLETTRKHLKELASEYRISKPDKQSLIEKEWDEYLAFRISNSDSSYTESALKDDVKNILMTSKLPVKEITLFYSSVYPLYMKDLYGMYTGWRVNAKNYLADKDMGKALDIQCAMQLEETRSLYYGVLEFILSLPKSLYNDLLHTSNAQFTFIAPIPVHNPAEAKDLNDRHYKNANELLMQNAELVKSMEMSLTMLELQLQEKRASHEQFEALKSKVSAKAAKLDLKKSELALKKQQLDTIHERLRTKNQLKDEDAQWLLWGKIIKFASASMYEDANSGVAFYQRTMDKRGENTSAYSMKASLFYSYLLSQIKKNQMFSPYINGHQIDKTGVIIVGFEHDSIHSCLQVGDIILERGGYPVRSADEFASLSNKTHLKPLTVLRFTSEGVPRVISLTSKEEDPRIGVLSLFEA